MNTLQQLKELISRELMVPEEDLTPETVLGKEVKCDSLDYTVLIMKIEEEFGINITPEDILTADSVGGICKIIDSK